MHNSRATIVFPDGGDKFRWELEKNGCFTVNSYYQAINDSCTDQIKDKRWLSCWDKKVQFRISFFSWLLLHHRIPSKSFLQRRHVPLNDISCSCCQGIEETIDHIFFTCSFAQQVWYQLILWLDFPCVLPSSTDALWDFWMGLFSGFSDEATKWSRSLVFAILWHLWLRRNKMTFPAAAHPSSCYCQQHLCGVVQLDKVPATVFPIQLFNCVEFSCLDALMGTCYKCR